MTASELIEKLKQFPPDTKVYVCEPYGHFSIDAVRVLKIQFADDPNRAYSVDDNEENYDGIEIYGEA